MRAGSPLLVAPDPTVDEAAADWGLCLRLAWDARLKAQGHGVIPVIRDHACQQNSTRHRTNMGGRPRP